MGDGKAGGSTSLSRGSTTTSATTSRRTTHRKPRSTNLRSIQVERQPLVLQLDSHWLRFGYGGQSQPQHVLSIECDTTIDSNNNSSDDPCLFYYSVWAPILEQVYDRLMMPPSTRRVVLIHPHDNSSMGSSSSSSPWLEAVKQWLWNKGVPSLTLFSNLQLVPIALGFKRGLFFHMSANETTCIVHADGHLLDFTYQVVPFGYERLVQLLNRSNDSEPDQQAEQDRNDRCLLPASNKTWPIAMEVACLMEDYPTSLVSALLHCLDTCPRDLRPDVVSNILWMGDGALILPDVGRRVVQRVENLLDGAAATPFADLSTISEKDMPMDSMGDLTRIPLSLKPLKPLASSMQLTSTAPYRPDWISWVGTSLWAATWNKYNDEESKIRWSFPPPNLTTSK